MRSTLSWTAILCLLTTAPALAQLTSQNKRDITVLHSRKGSVTARLAAAKRLGQAKRHEKVVRQLRASTLLDPDLQVRYQACVSLAKHRGPDCVDHLRIIQAKERHAGIKEKLQRLIEQNLPLQPLSKLVKAYATAETRNQRNALLTQIMRHPAKETAPHLLKICQTDPETLLRVRALKLLMRTDRERGLTEAKAVLEEPTNPGQLRAESIMLLARELPKPQARKLIEKTLSDKPSDIVVEGTIIAIREAKLPSQVPMLSEMLDHHIGRLRNRLIETIAILLSQSENVSHTIGFVEKLRTLPDLDQIDQVAARHLCLIVGQFGDERFVPGLADVLKSSPHFELPTHAATALARIGGQQAGTALIENLNNVLKRAQQQITRGLLRLRDPAHETQVLRFLSRNTDRHAGINGVAYLGAVGGVKSVPLLGSIIRHKGVHRLVQREAILALVWNGTPDALKLLLWLTGQPRSNARALQALQLKGPWLGDSDRLALVQGLQRARGSGRQNLLFLLAFTGFTQSRPMLEKLLDSDSSIDRETGLRALALLGRASNKALTRARKVVDNLSQLTGKRDAALFYLGLMGTMEDLPRLRKVAVEQEHFHATAIQALAGLGASGVHKIMRDRWVESRLVWYYDFWSRLPDEAVTQQLISDLRQLERYQFRTRAARALGIRGKGREALEQALAKDLNAKVRGAAARALAILNDRKAVPTLIKQYEGEGSLSVRQTILEAAGSLGGPEVDSWLQTRLKKAVGHPGARALLSAALAAGTPIDKQLGRRILQADTTGNFMPSSGMLAALGDETQVRWLWSDLCSPVSAHRIAAHRALRNRGYKPYYDVLIRRAQIEPFPRPELRNLMRRLEGAPPLGAGNRPEQDQQIAKIRAWWKAHRDQLVWDVRKRRFQLPSD